MNGRCHLGRSAVAGRDGDARLCRARWPRLQANDASVKLTALANALPKNDKLVDDFVAREIARGELTIGEPPALPDVSAIRELLLREPIVWERHDEIGDPDTSDDARGADDGGEGARRERADESARKRSGGVGRPARRVEARPLAGRASADDGADGRVVDGADDQRGRLENAAARAGVARRAAGARQRAAAARGVSVSDGVVLEERCADVSDEVARNVGRSRSPDR